jgi:phytoene desaturase
MMKRIVIVGGGIAGLSAGIFARKNGFESVILEKNSVLGGECTGWDRQGYHIDGCIHWLVGTKEGTPLHRLWTAVGALDGVEIYHPDSFLAFEHDGVTVTMYRDLDRLKSSWLSISPGDRDAIEEFCHLILQLQSYDEPADKPADMMSLPEKIRMLSEMKSAGMVMRKYGKTSLEEYARAFRHPALRAALASFLPDGYSASSILFALASFTKGQASIPRGGSRAFAARMAERYLSLGGLIRTGCQVSALIVKSGRASRAVCRRGESFEGDYFVAACDANVLFERLLGGKYPDRSFQERYRNPKDYPLASQVLVSLGYDGIIDSIPRSVSFPVAPFRVGEREIERLTITHFRHEPSFAPEGKTLITCAINQFSQDYDAWDALARDRERYQSEKSRVGGEVLRAVETRFTEMKGRISLLDVATPKTYERYCNAYRGAFMPFLPTVRGAAMAHTGRIRGLDNVYLSGQWLQPPGGLPVAVVTGKDTIMRICKREKVPFTGI